LEEPGKWGKPYFLLNIGPKALLDAPGEEKRAPILGRLGFLLFYIPGIKVEFGEGEGSKFKNI